MSALNALTIKSYQERAQQATRIQTDIARAERGEKVDLNQIEAKIKGLVEALNRDSITIGKTKITEQIHNAHTAHKRDLTALATRFNALSSSSGALHSWVKPPIYAA